MNVFDLAAKLTLDASGYEKGLNDASGQASSFGSKLKNGLGTAAKVGAAAVVAVGAAATKLTSSMMQGAAEVAEYGDHIDKMSQKIGISAEAYQEWDAVMQHSGTSIDSMQAGMKTLANAVENGNEAFERIGLTQEQIASMSQEDLFAATIEGLQNVDNETERTYLAGQLLGRGATELGALLNMSADETQQLKDRVHELGGVMSNDAVKSAAAYQDSLQDMQTAIGGLKNKLMSEFLPGITTVMDGLTELFAGRDGADKIGEGIDQITSKVTEMLPKVLKTAAQIVLKLGKSIIENLPKLASTAASVVLTLARGIIDNLPMLVSTALQIIVELANQIAAALPTLVPTIVDVVLKIVEILTNPDTLSSLIDAAIAIILGLADGIIAALPLLLERAPTIIVNLITAILENLPKLIELGIQLIIGVTTGIIKAIPSLITGFLEAFSALGDNIPGIIEKAKEWGKDLINNFIDGIKGMWNALKDTVSNIGGMIADFLGFSEPEKGPLSNFHTYAPDMMKLFAEGIEDNKGLITDAIDSSFDVRPQITKTVDAQGAGEEIIVPRGGAVGGGNTQTIVLEVDRVPFAKLVYDLNNDQSRRVGVKLAGGV